MRTSLFVLFLLTITQVQAQSFCISHKGSFKSAPENSLESLQAALNLGADGVEFDIQHTQDGYAILMHDKKLNTATHLPGKRCPLEVKINKLKLQDIRENCGVLFDGRYLPIPLLEEALQLVHDSEKFTFIELKDRPSAHTRELIQQYFQHKEENLRIIAFKPKNIDHLLTMSDENQEFWKKVRGLDLDVGPFGPHRKYGVNIWNRLFRLRRDEHYRRLDLETSVWTLNKENRIRKFLKQGVKFITTDEVEMCLRIKSEIK